jgi:hypothetical protein
VTVASYTAPGATTPAAPGPLGNEIFGLAVDPWGNVFVPDNANNRIAAYYPSVAPTLNFGSATIGTKSSIGDQSVYLFNAGDETLYLENPATGLNPLVTGAFALDNTVTGACLQAGQTGTVGLPADYECSLSLNFTPTGPGANAGSLVATDNNLYPPGYSASTTVWTTQTISATGMGTGGDFTFAVPNPASAVVNPLGTAVFTISVSPVGTSTFVLPVNFAITGAPAGSTATLSASTISAGASATALTLTLVAPPISSTAAANHPPSLGAKIAPIAFAVLLLPLFGIRRMRKTWMRYLTVLILLAGGLIATTALSGCSTTPSGYFGQGTTYDYTVTVTGTAGGLTHATSVLVTVN